MNTAKLDLRKVGIFIVFACILSLPCYSYISGMGNIDSIMKLIAGITIIAIIILNAKGFSISDLTIGVILYGAVLLLSTVLNKASLGTFLGYYMPILIVGLLFDHYADDLITLVSALMLLCEIICYLNLASIIAFPNGLYNDGWYWQNWILGYKNKFSVYLIVVLLIGFVHKQLGGSTLRTYGLYAACIASAVLAKSSTQILGFSMIVLLFVIMDIHELRINPYVLILINVVSYIVILIIGSRSRILDMITLALNRDATFSGRTVIWERVMELISKSPIIGCGVQANDIVANQLGYRWAAQAHNLILQILYQGGFAALFVYVVMINLCLKQINEVRDTGISKGATIILFVFFIMALMETLGGSGFTWIIFYIAYYSPDMVYALQPPEEENVE